MFCSQCGTELRPTVNFCTRCGAKILKEQQNNTQTQQVLQPQQVNLQAQPVYQETVQLQPQQSFVRWTLSAFEKVSMFKSYQCYIIFMSDRMIIDYLSNERIKRENEKYANEIRQSDMGFLKKSAAMMRFWSDFAKKYASMSPEQILALNQSNKEIWNTNVSQFVFRCYSQEIDEDGTTRGRGGDITIVYTNGEKVKYSHKESHHKANKEFLMSYFGNKLKYKR